MTTADYSLTMQDSTGRQCMLSINGASIDELISMGYSEQDAREGVESNAFGRAIERNEINADAWLIGEH